MADPELLEPPEELELPEDEEPELPEFPEELEVFALFALAAASAFAAASGRFCGGRSAVELFYKEPIGEPFRKTGPVPH